VILVVSNPLASTDNIGLLFVSTTYNSESEDSILFVIIYYAIILVVSKPFSPIFAITFDYESTI
jgi:hypothetical protein